MTTRAQVDRTSSRESLAVHPLAVDSAKYVPYTPRQRPTTTTTTTTTATATSGKFAQLKTAAHNIGIDASTVGWAILEKIAFEGDDWPDVWTALTKGRATLLLPVEPSTGHELITADIVQDHVLVACRDDPTAVVTLSGLRGCLVGETLSLRSSSKSLHVLSPLPVYPDVSSYPSFTLSSPVQLTLPARTAKPPLPPRPGVRGAPSPRLAMPFAALFGQRPTTPPPHSADLDSTIDITVSVIDTPLNRVDIATAIISALKGEIAIALNEHPPWLVERVQAFAIPYLPFVKAPAGKKKLQDIGGNPNRVVYAVNPALDKPEELADKFQAFYRAVEGELRNPLAEDEAHIRSVLETVEATLCTLLYDRLFLPSTSDDASHNEALSSRVAALNMLDLSLEHLDIDIGDADHTEMDAVVRACGQTLAQLDLSARSPREKAAVLVSAHKLVVEGLSKLPPIRLKSRDDAATTAVPSSELQSPSVPTIRLSTSPDQSSIIKRSLSPETTPSHVSGDVLLPVLIFSVVKANPSRLVSHLLYTQRFRNQTFGGEESYCLINLMAVAEFLENVDLAGLGLGLGDSDKVLSTADLTPISITRPNLPDSPIAPAAPGEEHLASLRGRVGQGVDAIAGSANKVISGVVDSSFGVLRAFLPGQPTPGGVSALPGSALSAVSGSSGATGVGTTTTGSGLGLLRRESGFSIAGLTAALPGGPSRARNQNHPEEEGQRELVEVGSRPASLRSHRSGHASGSDAEESSAEEESDDGEKDGEDGEVQGEMAEGNGNAGEEDEAHDVRSIKSFESMLSGGRSKRKRTSATHAFGSESVGRKRLTDLTDRLTHGMAEMSRRVQGGDTQKVLPIAESGRLPPPNRRFLECTEQDIRVSEVGELLREYQRLVEAVRNAGGFQE